MKVLREEEKTNENTYIWKERMAWFTAGALIGIGIMMVVITPNWVTALYASMMFMTAGLWLSNLWRKYV